MIDLSVQFDKNKFDKIITKAFLFGKDINRAINRAAKRAADSGKAETRRQMSREYTLPSKEIGKTIEARMLDMGAEMRITSGIQDILAFKGVKRTVVDTGVTVEIKKGNRHLVGNAFIGVLNKKQKRIGLYQRDNERRNVLRRYHGPSTVGMFKANEKVHNAALLKAMETLDQRMTHELGRLLNV